VRDADDLEEGLVSANKSKKVTCSFIEFHARSNHVNLVSFCEGEALLLNVGRRAYANFIGFGLGFEDDMGTSCPPCRVVVGHPRWNP
jgi:hypothetical protein